MRYPVSMKKDGRYVLVTFPDIPEALTQGNNENDALERAAEALETALEFYFEDGREVPAPSKVGPRTRYVELPVSQAAKVLLLNEMVRQKVRPSELARKMQVQKQEITRLTDLKHASKIDGIDSALRAMGKRLEVAAV